VIEGNLKAIERAYNEVKIVNRYNGMDIKKKEKTRLEDAAGV